MNTSSNGRPTIRFGIMCTGTRFQAWQVECLRKLTRLENVEPALLIIDAGAGDLGGLPKFIRRLKNLRNLFWYVYNGLGRIISRAMRPTDMSSELVNVPSVRCRVVLKGRYSQYFREEDLAKIRSYDLDFIVRFGFNIIRGEILEVARYGVWSFHHDDEVKYRGGPPCFWEVYRGDPLVGAILQRLTDRLDSGIVLRKGYFKTINTSYVRNRDRAFLDSSDWPAQVCTDILNGKTEYLSGSPSTTKAPIFRAPTNIQMLVFVFKLVRNVFVEAATRFFVADKWNVGVIDQPVSSFVDSEFEPNVLWLAPPARNRFSADPFGIRSEDGVHILYEDFDYYTSKGRISAVRVTGEEVSRPRVALDEPFHLSHPYLVEHDNAIYCIPEAAEIKQVVLYRADDFPTRWTRVATLVEDFAGVDPTVIRYREMWWLFATDENDGPNHKLKIWHAPDLMGPWTPHVLNPVKIDVCSARPAGTPYVHNDKLYRPSQDCSKTYGGRIVLNRVVTLTPQAFAEERVGSVDPVKSCPYPDGIHTVSSVGDVTVVDSMKKIFIGADPSMIVHKLRRIFKGTRYG